MSETTGSETSRRSFTGWLLGIGGAVTGALMSVPLVKFLLYPMTAAGEAEKWSDIGPISEFESLTTPVQRPVVVEQLDGWRKTVQEKVVYITKDTSGKLQVLTAICPHLGCSVQWNAGKNSFVCPCHSAAFSPDGKCTGGPAPRGMDTLEAQVKDGRLAVHYKYFRQLVKEKEVIG